MTVGIGNPKVGMLSLLWASVDRAEHIATIHARLFDPAWSADEIRKMLDDPGISAFVATVDHPQEVIGFVIGRMAADEGEILTIGVTPERQNQGIGLSLVQGLMRAFATAGVSKVYLEVAADNISGRALYEKAGFATCGHRKAYYERPSGPPMDALTMRRDVVSVGA
ncbi:MAG: ribosomal protein S18-alanine N-acetyltransferase [Hyphomicrobium sp.]|nr:ribosomal protein S18-alanine N-acetyltransferase [Hyphomicrobium sp.]